MSSLRPEAGKEPWRCAMTISKFQHVGCSGDQRRQQRRHVLNPSPSTPLDLKISQCISIIR
jgi:hypothetical protein